MSHNLLSDARLYRWLLDIDLDQAHQARAGACPHCGAALHTSDYPRKPRGPLGVALPSSFGSRLSLCCARDGCRKRLTPFSVRFLARRVYLGAVVLLATALHQGLTPPRVAKLRALLPVPRRTLARWLDWWRTRFAQSPFWRALRGSLRTPIPAAQLPLALLRAFAGELPEQIRLCLRFLLPVTSATAPGSLAP